ncbi:FimV/HubP family polar landmark protein [Tepidicella xavieri]|uniref:Pilus assembly protein FimV n=1 Tax=Tepidicella xavieri TaxID=360241 RepID=A0A4R6U9N0_9BURK|nr:FimV/HubP family polar landmark protein [Tepidicella xavieri]TDQ42512.1 pilus assembly protein FimV [Tepidicella xavieri]
MQRSTSNHPGATRSTSPRAADSPPPRRGLRAVALAVALSAAVTAGNAWALALGRISVQSLLGEPLRAEIDVPSITPEERASLQIGIASPDRFRAANMDFNALLQDVRLELVQRPDGRTVVRLSSDRVVTEPFLDVVVQATWNNGQLLRGYTLLFDPPNLRPAPAPLLPAAPTAPVVTEVRPAAPVPAPAPAARPSTPAPSAAPAPALAPRPAPVSPPASAPSAALTVQRGDTAGRIALAHLPAGVSLDQMLIAMLRANPHAFMGNNVNRLKAGVILQLPDASEAAAVNPAEARQLVQAQSRDFNEFRRRLAGMAPAQATPSATRSAEGTVQAEVADQRPAATAQDRLTLSKGPSTDPQAEQIAQARQQEATQARTGELDRNLQELQQLQEAARSVTADTTAATPAPEAAEAAAQAEPTPPGPAVETTTPTPPAPPPPPPPVETPAPAVGGFMQSLLAHPYALPAGGGLVALLGLLALMRIRRQRQEAALAASGDSPSEYMAAEGQTVDTREDAPVSSMMYSPSQLDAGGDVDPVAEADVYLAYGRDRQAEEILLEAVRLHPEHLPARLKLLDIYAQRNDVAAFNAQAAEVHALTGGSGEDWQQAREAGLRIDPDNPLYLKGSPDAAPAAEAPSSVPPDIDLSFDQPEPASAAAPASADDDLEALLKADAATEQTGLDFDLSDTPAPAAPAAPAASTDFDFDLTKELGPETAEPPPASPATSDTADGFDLDLSELESTPAAAPASTPELPPEVKDLSLDLDLDLETPTEPPRDEPMPATPATATETNEDPMAGFELDETLGDSDPLETKLSLAREFQAIGDTEGARSLAEEVEAEASGEMKARARAFLAQLG